MAASRTVGIPDSVAEDVTGLLFEAGSERDMADQVCRLLGDPELRDELGIAAIERAHREFAASAWVNRLRTAYLESMGQRP